MSNKHKVVSPGQLEFARITMKVEPRAMRQAKIDERLRLMCELRKPGQTFSQEEIAQFVGVWQQTVATIEEVALKKFVAECERQGCLGELIRHWR